MKLIERDLFIWFSGLTTGAGVGLGISTLINIIKSMNP